MRRSAIHAIGLGLLSLLLLCCSGGAMSEAETDSVSAESSQPAEAPAEAAAPDEEPADADSESYRQALAESVRSAWTQPGRANNTPPRIAVVSVYLGPGGRLIRWEWRRRSPVGRFNDSIGEYLDGLVGSSRSFPLPPEGTDLFREVLDEGVAIEFADDDA